MEKLLLFFLSHDITWWLYYRVAIWKRKSQEILVIHQTERLRFVFFSACSNGTFTIVTRKITGSDTPECVQTLLHGNYLRSFRFGPENFLHVSYLAFENVDDVDGVEYGERRSSVDTVALPMECTRKRRRRQRVLQQALLIIESLSGSYRCWFDKRPSLFHRDFILQHLAIGKFNRFFTWILYFLPCFNTNFVSDSIDTIELLSNLRCVVYEYFHKYLNF